MGQKKVYGITLVLMVIYSIASGLSFGSSPKGVMATLCFFRIKIGKKKGSITNLHTRLKCSYAIINQSYCLNNSYIFQRFFKSECIQLNLS
ncbi:hypothetical protein ACSBR1_031507 [Camellia fascicularis]